MADIGKVTPGNPVIPPVPQERPVDERKREEKERERKEKQQDEAPVQNDDDGDEEGGIDVYV